MVTVDFLGKGLRFPIFIDNFGKATMIEGASLVQQAIWDILKTPKGTRLMLHSYGSRLYQLEEKPMYLVAGLIKIFVLEAIAQEKRVKFLTFTKEIKGRELICELTYMIKATNQTESLIFPFFESFKN